MATAIGYGLSYLYLFAVIFGVGLLKRKCLLPAEWSRKLVHIFVSFTWLILYGFLFGTVHFIVIPASFVAVNFLSHKYGIFEMYERDGDENDSCGTVLYAVSMTVMAIVSTVRKDAVIPYGISVFCLSFGDGAAALVGSSVTKCNLRLLGKKSLAGTVACSVFACLGIAILGLFIPLDIALWKVLLLGLWTGILELLSGSYDNLAIPLGTMLLSSVLL